MLSGLMFKPLFHSEFIFVSGLRLGSDFILLHVVLWFSQHHLMERLRILCSLVKYKPAMHVRVYFLALNSIPLAWVCDFYDSTAEL